MVIFNRPEKSPAKLRTIGWHLSFDFQVNYTLELNYALHSEHMLIIFTPQKLQLAFYFQSHGSAATTCMKGVEQCKPVYRMDYYICVSCSI